MVVALVSALAVMAFFAGIFATFELPDEVTQRVEEYATVAEGAQRQSGGRKRGLASFLAVLDRVLTGQAVARRLALRLAQANLHLTAPEFLLIAFSAGMAGGALGFALQRRPISVFGGAALALLLIWVWLEWKRQRRINAFHDQLVPVLDLIVGSLRGGHALISALDLVSKEMPPPASEEFSRVLREMAFGLSQTEALNNLVRRMETDDLQLIVTAVNISHEVGGNLSHVLERISETIRERVRLQGEIRVLTTQQRLTTYLLSALPFILAVVLSLINPEWIMRLFRPGWIRAVPVAAIATEILGFLIAQKLTRIEV